MKAKEFFGKFTSFYLLGHLLAMVLVVVLLIVGVSYGLRVYTHHGEGVRIPNLTGMDALKARALLEQNELMMVVNDSGYNKRMPVNSILQQTPGAGMKVKRGRKIYVTVCSHYSQRLPLPDLMGHCSFRQAEAQLKAMGFKLLPEKREEGEYDLLLRIEGGGRELTAGERVSIETPLTLVIGGTRPDEIDEKNDLMMDSLLMENEAEAETNDFEF